MFPLAIVIVMKYDRYVKYLSLWMLIFNLLRWNIHQICPILVEDDDTSCSMESLLSPEELGKILGYSFKSQSCLLQHAFTHQSFQHKCESHERLELVGDSVLNLLITRQQFNMYLNLPPRMLSPLRSANVDMEKLACVAIKYGLLKYLRHNNCKLSHK